MENKYFIIDRGQGRGRGGEKNNKQANSFIATPQGMAKVKAPLQS